MGIEKPKEKGQKKLKRKRKNGGEKGDYILEGGQLRESTLT